MLVHHCLEDSPNLGGWSEFLHRYQPLELGSIVGKSIDMGDLSVQKSPQIACLAQLQFKELSVHLLEHVVIFITREPLPD